MTKKMNVAGSGSENCDPLSPPKQLMHFSLIIAGFLLAACVPAPEVNQDVGSDLRPIFMDANAAIPPANADAGAGVGPAGWVERPDVGSAVLVGGDVGYATARIQSGYRPPAPAYGGARTCYTGKRGGTYTITSGGNKNYAGC